MVGRFVEEGDGGLDAVPYCVGRGAKVEDVGGVSVEKDAEAGEVSLWF